MQTKFLRGQKGHPQVFFMITPAFTVGNLQGAEKVTIWTCSLTSTGTQRTSHETYRRDGKNTTIRYSVSLTKCANDMGESWWVVII